MKSFTIKFKLDFKKRAGVQPTRKHKNKKAYSRKKKHKNETNR